MCSLRFAASHNDCFSAARSVTLPLCKCFWPTSKRFLVAISTEAYCGLLIAEIPQKLKSGMIILYIYMFFCMRERFYFTLGVSLC